MQMIFRTVRASVLVGLGMLAVAIYLKVDKVRTAARHGAAAAPQTGVGTQLLSCPPASCRCGAGASARAAGRPTDLTVTVRTAFSACLPQPNNFYLSDETVPILNICFAAVLLPALLACFGLFWWRVCR